MSREGVALTFQIAEYYCVSESVARDNVRRHRDEFEFDGLRLLRGKASKDACETISHGSISGAEKTSNLTIWTPRAALRLGMLLFRPAPALAPPLDAML